MDLSEEPEVTIDGFKIFLLEYKDQPLIDRFINCVTRQHVSITAPQKQVVPHLIRGTYVDHAQIERESPVAAEQMKIDPVQQSEEFKKLIALVFSLYGQLNNEEKMQNRRI